MFKSLLITLILVSSVFSQEISINNKSFVFGKSEKEVNSLFTEPGGQIESIYNYIIVLEFDDGKYTYNAFMYNDKLIGLTVWTGIADNYEGVTELENLIAGYQPYKEIDQSAELGVASFDYYYDLRDYYLRNSVVRTQSMYDLFPKKYIEEIRKDHKDFAQDFF